MATIGGGTSASERSGLSETRSVPNHRKLNQKKAYAKLLVALGCASLLQPPGSDAHRNLARGKADEAKGTPTVYKTPKTSHLYKQTSQYLTMSDGTKIAVDVYIPNTVKTGEKLPVMFEQSRYWRVIQPKPYLKFLYWTPLSLYRSEFLKHGYVWVVSDARGAGASFGDRPWELPPLDIKDSKEIMDWIVKQPWSNGDIGLIGHSYSGNMAEFALMNKHSGVKAAAVLSSPFDIYADVLRPGGLPLQPFINDWMNLNKDFDSNILPRNLKFLRPLLSHMKPVDEDKSKLMLKQAVAEHKKNSALSADKLNFRDDSPFTATDLHATKTRDISAEFLRDRYGMHFEALGVDPSSPSDYWKEFDAAQVPMYMSSGWLEGSNSRAAVNRFLNYTSPGSKLILGPWEHDFFNISPFTRGGLSRFRIDREMLKFFDHYMLNKNSLAHDARVHYYTLGEERWHGSDTWPPKNNPKTLYLSADKSMHDKAPASEQTAIYKVDEKSGSGKNSRWDCLLGNVLLDPYSNRKSEDKHNICFQTAPLAENWIVSGNPIVKVFVKPNKEDCSLFVYLEDVSPSGSVNYVTEAQILCGNTLSDAQVQKYKTLLPMRTFKKIDYKQFAPGEVREVDLEMFPISYQFKKGHRVRLSIAGRDRDHFKLPPFAKMSDEIEIVCGDQHASQVCLPIEANESAETITLNGKTDSESD
jgi:putative CocE/NonD family hydrolase